MSFTPMVMYLSDENMWQLAAMLDVAWDGNADIPFPLVDRLVFRLKGTIE